MEEKQKSQPSTPEKSGKLTIKLPKINPWIVTTVILLLFSIVLFVKPQLLGRAVATGGDGTTEGLTPEEAANEAIAWIDAFYNAQGADVTLELVSAEETENGIVEFSVKISSGGQTQTQTLYVTADGMLFLPQAIETADKPTIEPTTTTLPSVVKSDRPEVRGFVMSHCPYGLQFIKAYVPVIELLGDKADFYLNFVNYAMHGETEVYEQLRMYCIKTEQQEKFTDYLRCFVEDGDSERCLDEVGIDKTALQTCMDATDEEYVITETLEAGQEAWGSSFPPFPIDDELNMQLGVQGSPTFVINGQVVSVNRSPEAIKDAVCNAFNTPPEECETELSSTAEAAGFGPVGSGGGSGSGGACG